MCRCSFPILFDCENRIVARWPGFHAVFRPDPVPLRTTSPMSTDSISTTPDPSIEGPKPRRRRRWPWWIAGIIIFFVAWHLLSRVTTVVPPPARAVADVTDRIYDEIYSDAIIQRAGELPPEVNILLVGLDNRVGSNDNHADAIHLITVRTKDSVGVTITSIPRGTEVKGYGIDPEFSFMANVRALKGRVALMKAVRRLARKKKIDYYVEVTFSQVMGVLELLGYKDPATALQYLRHRKSYILGDVQRSYNQGKFIRSQMIRRADLLTGAKGDLLIRMGLGMVDTDLDVETVQAFVYLLRNRKVLDSTHVLLEMRPKINMARLDQSETPDPDQIAGIVSRLVRRTGNDIDDLGRYNPYPRIKSVVSRAAASGQSPKAVISILEPIFAQKAWLQVQERPLRRELRDSVEDLLIRAYTALKKHDKANEVHQYMVSERKAFSEVEREARRFTYGRRPGAHKPSDAATIRRARRDNLGQTQTHVEPQPTSMQAPAVTPPAQHTTDGTQSTPDTRRDGEETHDPPKQESAKQDGGEGKTKETEIKVMDIKP